MFFLLPWYALIVYIYYIYSMHVCSESCVWSDLHGSISYKRLVQLHIRPGCAEHSHSCWRMNCAPGPQWQHRMARSPPPTSLEICRNATWNMKIIQINTCPFCWFSSHVSTILHLSHASTVKRDAVVASPVLQRFLFGLALGKWYHERTLASQSCAVGAPLFSYKLVYEPI